MPGASNSCRKHVLGAAEGAACSKCKSQMSDIRSTCISLCRGQASCYAVADVCLWYRNCVREPSQGRPLALCRLPQGVAQGRMQISRHTAHDSSSCSSDKQLNLLGVKFSCLLAVGSAPCAGVFSCPTGLVLRWVRGLRARTSDQKHTACQPAKGSAARNNMMWKPQLTWIDWQVLLQSGPVSVWVC